MRDLIKIVYVVSALPMNQFDPKNEIKINVKTLSNFFFFKMINHNWIFFLVNNKNERKKKEWRKQEMMNI